MMEYPVWFSQLSVDKPVAVFDAGSVPKREEILASITGICGCSFGEDRLLGCSCRLPGASSQPRIPSGHKIAWPSASCREHRLAALCDPEHGVAGASPFIGAPCQFWPAFYRECMSEHKVTLGWKRG